MTESMVFRLICVSKQMLGALRFSTFKGIFLLERNGPNFLDTLNDCFWTTAARLEGQQSTHYCYCLY